MIRVSVNHLIHIFLFDLHNNECKLQPAACISHSSFQPHGKVSVVQSSICMREVDAEATDAGLHHHVPPEFGFWDTRVASAAGGILSEELHLPLCPKKTIKSSHRAALTQTSIYLVLNRGRNIHNLLTVIKRTMFRSAQ